MEDLYKVILAVSSYITIIGLIGKLIRDHLHIVDPIIATIYGIIIGPTVTDLFSTDPIVSRGLLFTFARIVLAFQIMTIALQLPDGYCVKKFRSLFMLLFPASFVSAVVVFLLVWQFSNFDAITSWAIASACTPTDPVLSNSIMKGDFANKYIPEQTRRLLAAESGLNDGVGVVFIYLVTLSQSNLMKSLENYFISAIFVKTFMAGITGYLTGYVLGRALRFCHSRRYVGRSSVTIFGIALSLFCMCLAIFLQQSELIFIFFTGIAFSKSEWFVLETRGSQFQLLVESVFNISFLIFFGARIDFGLLDLKIFFISIAILLLRRPIAIAIFYRFIPDIENKREAFIVAWFGPIGVGSLYYAVVADRLLHTDTTNFISFLVLFSILLYGLSVPAFLSVRYVVMKFRRKDEDPINRNLYEI